MGVVSILRRGFGVAPDLVRRGYGGSAPAVTGSGALVGRQLLRSVGTTHPLDIIFFERLPLTSNLHVGDLGSLIRVTVTDAADRPLDISSASLVQMIFRKPDGTGLTRTGVFVTDGTDGGVQYTTQAGDLDLAGNWRLQARVVTIDDDKRTDPVKFRVLRNLP